MSTRAATAAEYVVCVENADYPVSLELHKIYRALPDEDALAAGTSTDGAAMIRAAYTRITTFWGNLGLVGAGGMGEICVSGVSHGGNAAKPAIALYAKTVNVFQFVNAGIRCNGRIGEFEARTNAFAP